MDMIYDGTKKKKDALETFLKNNKAPSWRTKEIDDGKNYQPSDEEKEIVNLALHLRRPILLGGDPGVGKSSLAKSVNYTLECGNLLHWQITTHSVLNEGLYEYDAIARLQDVKDTKTDNKPIGNYITLGALGSAFVSDTMRVVLIDELDKSDIDFPNNLLHVLEEREFSMPELTRTGKSKHTVYNDEGEEVNIELENGKLKCKVFPLIIMTSNNEREFPPAFNRRILMHNIIFDNGEELFKKRLYSILELHLSEEMIKEATDDKSKKEIEDMKAMVNSIIDKFIVKVRDESIQLSTDQLMHAVFLELKGIKLEEKDRLKKIWHKLSE